MIRLLVYLSSTIGDVASWLNTINFNESNMFSAMVACMHALIHKVRRPYTGLGGNNTSTTVALIKNLTKCHYFLMVCIWSRRGFFFGWAACLRGLCNAHILCTGSTNSTIFLKPPKISIHTHLPLHFEIWIYLGFHRRTTTLKNYSYCWLLYTRDPIYSYRVLQMFVSH